MGFLARPTGSPTLGSLSAWVGAEGVEWTALFTMCPPPDGRPSRVAEMHRAGCAATFCEPLYPLRPRCGYPLCWS
jgi:hypothetical protein